VEKMTESSEQYALKLLRAHGVKNQILYKLCEHVCASVEFRFGYGSVDKHHAYRGGLLKHTAEVVCMAHAAAAGLMFNSEEDQDDFFDVLTTAAIWHDFGKKSDYGISDGVLHKTLYASRIGHVAGSYASFMCAYQEVAKHYTVYPATDRLVQRVGHAILAHHGRQEYGSPVEPQSLEALLLHHADMISAGIEKERECFIDVTTPCVP
jgi:3'-5' exoribonuclease